MKNNTLHWLWVVPDRRKLNILALIVVQAVNGASGVLYALLLRESVDSAAGHDRLGFWRYMTLFIGLVIVQLALRAVIRWLTELSKSVLENIFKGRLVNILLHGDYLRVSAVHSGEWLNRLTSDTKVVADGYVDILPGIAGMLVKLVSALVMIVVLEPLLVAILIPIGALFVLFTWLFRRKLKVLHKRIQETDGRLRVFLQDRIGSLLMIRSFAAEEQTETEAGVKMREHKVARMRRNRFANLANIGFGAVMSGMYLLGVCWCGYGILVGSISFGTLTAVTQLISQIQAPFANITGYLPRYYAMLASADRLMEAEAFDREACDAKPLEEMLDLYKNGLQSVVLKDVSFAFYPASETLYRQDKYDMPVVVRNLSLKVRKGKTLALTGHSGCGKSTALRLLMCVYQPDSGARYFIDAKGNTNKLSAAYRRLFAYVPQGNYLMSGTIREVVSFAEPKAANDTERLTMALRIACAEEFVSKLDHGVDTLLGERGAGLSEGQMQRLAIARAIYSGSPILLLDEATSALDIQKEKQLLENLRSMTDKTVVIVTHRPAALAICDCVLEFTENEVICHE